MIESPTGYAHNAQSLMNSSPSSPSLVANVSPWSTDALQISTPAHKYLVSGDRVADDGLKYVAAPLPRSYHSSSTVLAKSGHFFIFGGAVDLQLKNDTWAIRLSSDPESLPGTGPNSMHLEIVATLLETTGKIPSPRVGHRSALADGSLIVWGGITSVKGPDDNSIYSLNLSTHNWIRLDIQPGPSARALHAACMCGGRLVVFGGAASENRVLNDLWSFDISSLTQGNPKWEPIPVLPEGHSPPERGGHAMVAYEDKLYVFGGSNDDRLYNDTWCFDMSTRAWTELRISGAIPPPRAYHALTLVGDSVYLFGGCGADWKELRDTWRFEINEQRWCEIPPADSQPAGRSHHTLVTFKERVLVFGGEQGNNRTGGIGNVNILDTGLINYPKNMERGRSPPITQINQSNSAENNISLSHDPILGPSQYTITGAMSVSKIFRNLVLHGCRDASKDLDISHVSEYPISSGGFGDVYCATLRNGDRVGLKCLRIMVGSTDEGKKFLKRAAHELYVWSKCKHPYVLELSGVMLFRNRIAMVSPWVENGHLRWFLSRGSEVDRCALSAQIADGVDYLHGQGIVHGDLKPENVLISRDRTPKLTDFGNAALAEYTLQFTNSSTTQSMSVRWTAPEILKEETKTTQAGDIFALGMIIFETVTGLLPYAGSSDPVVMFSIASGKLPDRPEAQIPNGVEQADRLWATIASCWAYNPNERPRAQEVRSKMDEITFRGLNVNPVA